MAHLCVIISAILLAAFSAGLYCKSFTYRKSFLFVNCVDPKKDVGISTGDLYLKLGIIVSSAVLPATLTLMWGK